ncbi:MAG TPA: hypothetical protein VJ574_06525, partial [Candidatus Bathyarchaeia archaeon]|nr:hypothetical protein [Candidatus Bathyarchaeia archaeon]
PPLLMTQRWTVVSTISAASVDLTQTDLRNQVLDPAVNYLYRNYNATTGLNYNSPDKTDLQNTYWVYSDNFLASYVLSIYDQDNTSLISRAGDIWAKMEGYLLNKSITNPMNQYMVLNLTVNYTDGSLPEGTMLEERNGYVIKTHINNLTGVHPAPENYSDIAFLQAIYYHKLGNGHESEAMKVYNDGVSCSVNLTDGMGLNGMGFKDKAFNDNLRDHSAEEYQTYKLALYIYASKSMLQDYDQRAFDTLLAMQQPDGGFKTGYDSSLNAQDHSTNMETTSLAVLALNFEEADEGVDSLLAIAAIVVIVLAAIVIVAYFLIRKKSAIPPQAPIKPPKT